MDIVHHTKTLPAAMWLKICFNLRGGVLTPVILTPSARGRAGPGGDFLHRFVWIVVDWLDPVDPADCSKLGFRRRKKGSFLEKNPRLPHSDIFVGYGMPCHAMACHGMPFLIKFVLKLI